MNTKNKCLFFYTILGFIYLNINCTHVRSPQKSSNDLFLNKNLTYIQPIGPGLIKIFPHLSEYEGKIILGNNKVQLIIKADDNIENVLPTIIAIYLYEEHSKTWNRLFLIKSINITNNKFSKLKAKSFSIKANNYVSGITINFENNQKIVSKVSFLVSKNQNSFFIIKKDAPSTINLVSFKIKKYVSIINTNYTTQPSQENFNFTINFEDEAFRIISYQPFNLYKNEEEPNVLGLVNTQNKNNLQIYEFELGKGEYAFDFLDPNVLRYCNPNNFIGQNPEKTTDDIEVIFNFIDRVQNCAKTDTNAEIISIKLAQHINNFPYQVFITNEYNQILGLFFIKYSNEIKTKIPYGKKLFVKTKPTIFDKPQMIDTLTANALSDAKIKTINLPKIKLHSINIENTNSKQYEPLFFELIDLADPQGGSFLKFVTSYNQNSFKYLRDSSAQILKEKITLKLPYGEYLYRVFTPGLGTLCTQHIITNNSQITIKCELKLQKIINEKLATKVKLQPQKTFIDFKNNLSVDIYTNNNIPSEININDFESSNLPSYIHKIKLFLYKNDVIAMSCPSESILPQKYQRIINTIKPEALSIYFCENTTKVFIDNIDFSKLDIFPILLFNNNISQTLWHPYPPVLLKLNLKKPNLNDNLDKESFYVISSGAIMTQPQLRYKKNNLKIKTKIFFMPDVKIKLLKVFSESQLIKNINIKPSIKTNTNYLDINEEIITEKFYKAIRLEVWGDVIQKVNKTSQSIIIKNYSNILLSASGFTKILTE